jgi:hypothetical protein
MISTRQVDQERAIYSRAGPCPGMRRKGHYLAEHVGSLYHRMLSAGDSHRACLGPLLAELLGEIHLGAHLEAIKARL